MPVCLKNVSLHMLDILVVNLAIFSTGNIHHFYPKYGKVFFQGKKVKPPVDQDNFFFTSL